MWQRLLAADNHERYPERDRSVLSYLFSAEIRQAKIAEFGEVICDTFVFHLQVSANHHETPQKIEAGNHGKIVATDINAY